MKHQISRRQFLQMVGSTAPFIMAGCGSMKALTLSGAVSSDSVLGDINPASKAKDANVLMICIDDLNDWINGFGGYTGTVHTPNIDRLARMGVSFRKAYCAVPWCAPSRAATLTGIAPNKSKYYGDPGNMGAYAGFQGVQTLPQYFQSKGYRTLGGGKVFHGQYYYGPGSTKTWDTCGQESLGWTQYQTFADELRPATAPNNGLTVGGQFDWSSNYNPDEASMPDMQIAQWAAEILRGKSAQKFFLAAGIYRPHLPWYAPKRFQDLYPLDQIQIPAHLLPSAPNDLADVPSKGVELSNPNGDHAAVVNADPQGLTVWKKAIQAYLASISFADACVGVILDALASGPHANNTVVVLWSDNGFQLGEKRGWRKFKLWEKSARVPMMIALPGNVNAGAVCERPVSLLDIYPTLTEACFQTTPAHLDGNSLLPLMKNPNANWGYGAITSYSQDYKNSQIHRSVRTENYRYIQYYDGSEELYNEKEDPNELRNLMHPSNGSVDAARIIANALKAMLPRQVS